LAYSLLYIVGNNDVKINGHQKFVDFHNTTQVTLDILKRAKGKKITEKGFILPGNDKIQISIEIKGTKQTFDEDLTTIELPIFVPIIQKVMQDCHAKPDKIYLFGTEQIPSYHQDTIYAARLIEYYITEIYKILSENIIIKKIEKSPFDYDQMAEYFAFFFKENQDLKNNAINYISLTAGTPAETLNIALASMDLSVKYLYLPRYSTKCKEVRLLSQLNRQKYASIIKELINNYEYRSALEIARESPYGSNFQLLTLLEVMRRRILFDFEEALKESRKIDVVDKIIRNLVNNLADLSQLEEKKIIEELFYRIELSFKKKNYLEGIALLFSLVENLLQFQFKAATRKKIEKVNREFKEFNEFILEKSYIENKEKYLNNPNRSNLRELLALISRNESPIKGIDETNIFINQIERPVKINGKEISILDLRNRSPYAHGNMGITEDLLKKIYPPYGAEGIINDLKFRIRSICPSLSDNPFHIINDLIIKSLEIS